jgi:RHS repeat-associated protein
MLAAQAQKPRTLPAELHSELPAETYGAAFTFSETCVISKVHNGVFHTVTEAPFGNIIKAEDTDCSGIVHDNPFRFSTKYHDDETGLVYYGYRFHDPELGRWLSRDPIGEYGGLNLYAFVGNDPVSQSDPLGLYELDLKPAEESGIVGWPYKYVRAGFWGRAKKDDDVTCVCSDDCPSMTCTIKVHYDPIEISDRLKDGRTVSMTIPSKTGSRTIYVSARNTYGHEQRHIRSYLRAIKNEDPKAFFDALRQAEAVVYASVASCRQNAQMKSRQFTRQLSSDVYPGHDTERGGPETYAGYGPLNGVFPEPLKVRP